MFSHSRSSSQNQTGRDNQWAFFSRNDSMRSVVNPSFSWLVNRAALFQVSMFVTSSVIRLGYLDTKCGASTRISCSGSTSRSSHFEILAAPTLAKASSLMSTAFGTSLRSNPLPDFVTNCRNVVSEGLSPKNWLIERGNISNISKARPRTWQMGTSKLSLTPSTFFSKSRR